MVAPFVVSAAVSGGKAVAGKTVGSAATQAGAVAGVASTVLQDVLSILKGFEPVAKIFKLLGGILMVMMIPLLPLIKGIINLEAWFMKKMLPLMKTAEVINQVIMDGVLALPSKLKDIWGKAIDYLKNIPSRIAEGFKSFIVSFKNAWSWLTEGAANVGEWIRDKIMIPAWDVLKDVGMWIWNRILFPAWDYLKDVGKWIWNILKGPLDSVASKIRGAMSSIKNIGKSIKDIFTKDKSSSGSTADDFISRPGQALQKFSGNDTIIGVKNPSKLMGNGQITININNTTVRNDDDIRKLTQQISNTLQSQFRSRVNY